MAEYAYIAFVIWTLCHCVSYARIISTVSMNIGSDHATISEHDHGCFISGQMLSCMEIPTTIPDNITNVIIRDHRKDLVPQDFTDKSWAKVETLHFSGHVFGDVHPGQFAGLIGVKELTLSLVDVHRFNRHSLMGLDNVWRLEMIDMPDLMFWTLSRALTENNGLHRLQELVFNPGSHLNSPVVSLTDAFLKTLTDKPLTTLNLSNTIILGHLNPSFIKLCLKLDVLNVSHATVVQQSVDKDDRGVTDIAALLAKRLQRDPLLWTLDISGVKSTYGQTLDHDHRPTVPFQSPNHGLTTLWPGLSYIVNIHANRIQHTDLDFSDQYDLRSIDVLTRRLYLRNNNVVNVTGGFRFNEHNPVELFDVSQNKIEYIIPDFFSTMINLQYLYFFQNRLYKMQHDQNFSCIFRPLINLWELSLSSNGFTFLPRNMFQGNVKLRRLNLASNMLDTVMFDLYTLDKLEYLDLRNNAIRSLDGTNLVRLQSYVHARLACQCTDKLVIDLAGNALTCSCSSLPFVKWLASLHGDTERASVHAPTCLYEGQPSDINNEAVTKCKFLCHKTLIITLSVMVSVFLCIVVTSGIILFIKCSKWKRHVNKEQMFKRNFLSGKLLQSYMIFLAYSSDDEEIVLQVILGNLKRGLQKRLEEYPNPVSTGDDFRPGLSIVEESYRFVKLSCVFVAIVSESFCRSPFCRAEVQEACNQNKPIILLFLGHVDEENMTPYMREVFQRNSRVKLVRHAEGHFEFVPSLDTTCDSIMCLAVDYTLDHTFNATL